MGGEEESGWTLGVLGEVMSRKTAASRGVNKHNNKQQKWPTTPTATAATTTTTTATSTTAPTTEPRRQRRPASVFLAIHTATTTMATAIPTMVQ